MTLHAEWILNPLTSYAIVAGGLLAMLFLWFGARMGARKSRREIAAMKKGTDGALQELATRVNEIMARPEPEPPLDYPRITQSLNLTRRARALHMRRRGDEPHTIAAALGASRGEVELLLKLNRIFQQRAEVPTSER